MRAATRRSLIHGPAPAGEGLATTLLTGLECYWTLDEASGASRADSHGVETLTNNGTVGQAAGVLGNAASFDNNAANYLSRADNPNLRGGDTDWTLNCWTKLTSKTDLRMLLAKCNDATSEVDFWLFYYDVEDVFRFDVFSGSGTTLRGEIDAHTFGAAALDTWYMVSCGHSATRNEVWISVNAGTRDTATTTGAAGSSAYPFRVGQAGPFTMHGAIDSVGYWKRELTGAELSALYNGGSGLEYPFLGGPALYSTLDTQDSAGVNIRILVPNNHQPGTGYPVVLYHHGMTEDYTAVLADALKLGVVRNLLGNGYIVAGSSQHGDSWGSDDGTADMLHLYQYLNSRYVLSRRTVHFSQSAGGPSGLLCSTADFAVPHTKGWFGIYPACDLAWCYAQAGFTASIDTAYGITNPPTYATQTAGHDPILLAASAYAGLRMRFYASAGDVTVTKADNTDPMRTLVTGQATELELVTATGGHGDASHFRPTDVATFCARCV